MFRLLRVIAPLLFLVAASTLFAAPPADSAKGPAERVKLLQKKYQGLQSLEFDFSQYTQTSGRMKQGSGNAVFYRSNASAVAGKGVMRWNYTEPTPQTILNDGTNLSIYTPQDKQLIISPVHDLETDITYAIFTGTRNLLDAFEAAPADRFFILNDPPAGLEAVLLTPRQPHPQVKRIQLWLDGDHAIHRLLMEDHFGALTELTLTKVRFNALPPGDRQKVQSLLKLDLLPGTETIRQ